MSTANRILVIAFLTAIVLPGMATWFGVDGAPADENRRSAPPPTLRPEWRFVREFPDAFTRYFEDHFALRAPLVRAQADLRLRALRVSPSPSVIVGREGWLFYGEDGAVEEYAVAPSMSVEDLEVWRRTLQDIHDWLAEQGIAYVFVIAPDKHAIYPELMPRSIHRLANRSRIDQFVEHLRAHSSVNVLDLRPALLEAKARERLYHRTDTHWNDRGAFVAYQQILASVQIPGLTAMPRSAFDGQEIRTEGLDLAGMLGLKSRLQEVDLKLVPRTPRRARTVEPRVPDPHGIDARIVTERPGAGLPRAVVYRDSFGSALIPFLSEHFSRALYLWEPDVDPRVIAEERPNVVIQEWVGRRLGPHLPYNPVAGLARATGIDAGHRERSAGAEAAHSRSPASLD
jgi:alginate O-acetyltransferase complex protein AlgJ